VGLVVESPHGYVQRSVKGKGIRVLWLLCLLAKGFFRHFLFPAYSFWSPSCAQPSSPPRLLIRPRIINRACLGWYGSLLQVKGTLRVFCVRFGRIREHQTRGCGWFSPCLGGQVSPVCLFLTRDQLPVFYVSENFLRELLCACTDRWPKVCRHGYEYI
jgi:hypothetical protein